MYHKLADQEEVKALKADLVEYQEGLDRLNIQDAHVGNSFLLLSLLD